MSSKELHQSASLTPAQMAAIKSVKSLSKVIISKYPEVADDYRSGLNQVEIASKYGLILEFGIRIARGAVGKALQTLIPDKEEREKLAKEKMIESGSQSREISSEGLVVLQQSMRSCIKAIGKTSWIIYLVEPISGLNEPDFLVSLASNPEYIIKKGVRKGHPDCFKIADKLNEVFHQGAQIRSPKAVSTHLGRLKKRKKT